MAFNINAATLIYDFRFDIAGALMSTNTINSAVAQISDSARRAEESMVSLGASVLTTMGALPSGIIGLFGAAIRASESFDQTLLSWSNLLSANKDMLEGPVNTHTERLAVARDIMKDIAKMSREFGLPHKEMSKTSEMINAMLIPKGLQGTNFQVGHNMARQLMKSAPNLGIDPSLSMSQLLRAIQGGAGMGDPLFRSLVSETSAMRKFGKAGGTEEFNRLQAPERVRLLNEALSQFSNDSAVISDRFKSLTGQLIVLKDVLSGFDGILKPLGDKIKGPIVDALMFFNKALDNEGRIVLRNLAQMIGVLAPTAEAAVVNLTQAQRAQNSLNFAKEAASFLGYMMLVNEGLKLLSKFTGMDLNLVKIIGNILNPLRRISVVVMEIMMPWMRSIMSLVNSHALRIIGPLLMKVFLPVAALLAALTVIDRAHGYARVADIKNMPAIAAQVSEWMAEISEALTTILFPLIAVGDATAQFISPLFQASTWIEFIKPGMEDFIGILRGLGEYSMLASAGFQTLSQTIGDFVTLNQANKNKSFMDAFNDIYDTQRRKLEEMIAAGLVTPKQNVNIGKVSIENKFKENMEPDRIAFTIKEQLLRLGTNSLQAKGQPIYPAYGRP